MPKQPPAPRPLPRPQSSAPTELPSFNLPMTQIPAVFDAFIGYGRALGALADRLQAGEAVVQSLREQAAAAEEQIELMRMALVPTPASVPTPSEPATPPLRVLNPQDTLSQEDQLDN